MKPHAGHKALTRRLARHLTEVSARHVHIVRRTHNAPTTPQAAFVALTGEPGCGAGRWTPLSCDQARQLLTELFHESPAYSSRMNSLKDAGTLADAFLAVVEPGATFWSNTHPGSGSSRSWNPATHATFDLGVLAFGEEATALVWIEDED